MIVWGIIFYEPKLKVGMLCIYITQLSSQRVEEQARDYVKTIFGDLQRMFEFCFENNFSMTFKEC